MDNLFEQRIINANSVFSDHYLDSKSFYLYNFNSVPCISLVNFIDGEKAFEAFKTRFDSLLTSVHRYREFTKKQKTVPFNETFLVLKNNCILEFNNNYCEILHDFEREEFVVELIEFMKTFKQKVRKKPLEINLVTRNGSYFDLRAAEIKKTSLDLDLFYEDDFKPVDELIRKRLNKKNDKGIVLLHGLPGAGKTTYLRYLIGKIRKRVLFLSPDMASSLVDPEFIDLLFDNPNSVLIIEDAENIIMDRKMSSNSSVSNLLNISDGLLADFLNVQLVCTFNNSLTLIDSALMRKGRLIAKYEFGKLNVAKAQRLSAHLGYHLPIHEPMTIAEITNHHERNYQPGRMEGIGFRRTCVEN